VDGDLEGLVGWQRWSEACQQRSRVQCARILLSVADCLELALWDVVAGWEEKDVPVAEAHFVWFPGGDGRHGQSEGGEEGLNRLSVKET